MRSNGLSRTIPAIAAVISNPRLKAPPTGGWVSLSNRDHDLFASLAAYLIRAAPWVDAQESAMLQRNMDINRRREQDG
jgi:hypothetical protein